MSICDQVLYVKHKLCLFVTKCCTFRALPRQSHTLCIVINVVKYVTCVTLPITTFVTTRTTPIKTFPCLTSPRVWNVVFFPQPLVLLHPFIVEIVGCGHFCRCLSHFLVSHLGSFLSFHRNHGRWWARTPKSYTRGHRNHWRWKSVVGGFGFFPLFLY